MATPAQTLTNIAVAIATLTGGTRLGSDLSENVERIPAGGLRFALKSLVSAPQIRSNDTSSSGRVTIAMELAVHYRLGAAEAERTYTEGSRLTHMSSLLNPLWWEAISGVGGIAEPVDQARPATQLSDFTRDGDGEVITYRITVAVIVEP
jgi:hypothetical protein